MWDFQIHSEPESALWCVAKLSFPNPIIQEPINSTCGFATDYETLQPNGECFQQDPIITLHLQSN
ncbi:hypothetical protein Hanom_Chr11g01030251 [Helianthus anomalus]